MKLTIQCIESGGGMCLDMEIYEYNSKNLIYIYYNIWPTIFILYYKINFKNMLYLLKLNNIPLEM